MTIFALWPLSFPLFEHEVPPLLFYTGREQSMAWAGWARPARADSGGEGPAGLGRGRAWLTTWPAAARGPLTTCAGGMLRRLPAATAKAAATMRDASGKHAQGGEGGHRAGGGLGGGEEQQRWRQRASLDRKSVV